MKPHLAVAIGLATFAAAAPALAVDIENVDDSTYQIVITESDGEPDRFQLMPGDLENGVCAARCTVKVEGVGWVEADEDDVVVIRDGRISKRPKRL